MQRSSVDRGALWGADIAFCRSALASGSRSFYAASLLLPRRVREPASALYAFCRLADDEVDLKRAGASAIAKLRDRLDLVYRGAPLGHPVDRALASVIDRFAISRDLPEALLDGLEWDAAGRRYRSLSELHDYSARVAGTVGVMMAVLMGVRAPRVLARAADLGVAMQLTNIARDVGEDARSGRIYLPLEWLAEAGIDAEAWLAAPRHSPALAGVVERLLAAADTLYARADQGIAELPRGCRPGIAAARLIYAEIGQALRRSGADSVTRRTVVPIGRKLALLASAAVATGPAGRHEVAPCLEQTRFLIEAVGPLPPQPVAGRGVRKWWNFRKQAIWVLDLFEQLERRKPRDDVEASAGLGA
jgi:15-cis-phytoene synthase